MSTKSLGPTCNSTMAYTSFVWSLLITCCIGLISVHSLTFSPISEVAKRPRLHQLYVGQNSHPTDPLLGHQFLPATTYRLTALASHDANDLDESGDVEQIAGKGKSSRMERITNFAKTLMVRPIGTAAPKAIADILTDATYGAVDLAVDEVSKVASLAATAGTRIIRSRAFSRILEEGATLEGDTYLSLDKIALAKTSIADAFLVAEQTIHDAEIAIQKSKQALTTCKKEVIEALAAAENAAVEARRTAEKATVLATHAAHEVSSVFHEQEMNIVTDETEFIETTKTDSEISTLRYEDVDYQMSEMAPPFINEDQCLVPGEAVVRVEKAPDNSRRIFAGIDITASVDEIWNLLTDYEHLQRVVPNLVVNEVLELYNATDSVDRLVFDPSIHREEQCRSLSMKMKGAKLRQVGGAKVVGINFSARCTLEVREWPDGIPDLFHFSEDVFQGESRTERARNEKNRKLERYHFPRPFAISKLPTKDISMQSVEKDDGEFRLYQGVWRMQPLPGCSPPGGSAMRLTYAVEISPRPYLPVGLVEGRISQDLCTNLRAIRDYVEQSRLRNRDMVLS